MTILYRNGGDQLLTLDELRNEVEAEVADLPPDTWRDGKFDLNDYPVRECKALADAVTALGGAVGDPLERLLSAYVVLSRPAAAENPERAIVDHALKGTLTQKRLDELLPAAAQAQLLNGYRAELARNSEHTLVGAFHRELETGGADMILDSLRSKFDEHANAIERARALINPESSAAQILDGAEPGVVEAWQSLSRHVAVITKIAAVASQFGCRPAASFPQVNEYANADGYLIEDRALMCCAGGLETDSAAFRQPDQGHRSSPWFRVALRLHTVDEARDRYREWASGEWERLHSGPRGGWVDQNGKVHEHPKPTNPFAPVRVST